MPVRTILSALLYLISALGAYAFDVKGMPNTLDGILQEFDLTLKERDRYIQNRNQVIDSLKSLFDSDINIKRRLELVEALGREYHGVQVDSAIGYLECGSQLANEIGLTSKALRFEAIKCADAPMRDFTTAPVVTFEAIDTTLMLPEDMPAYYLAGTRLYVAMLEHFKNDAESEHYMDKMQEMAEKLMSVVPEDSPEYSYSSAIINFKQGHGLLVQAYFNSLLNTVPVESSYYAFAARWLGILNLREEKVDDALYYLTLAAISELKAGVIDGPGFQTLGRALINIGDTERGYIALMIAMENAAKAGAKILSMEQGQFAHFLRSYAQKRQHTTERWVVGLWIVVALLLLVVAALVYDRCRLKRVNSGMHVSCEDLRKSKEQAVRQFVGLCSDYMEKVEDFNRLARRKISAGQVEDLYGQIKSGKILDEQVKLFYEVFDKTFLQLYPTFIEDINKLLQPDKQIITTSPQQFTTELRIFAFMRLGVDDSTQIARLLGLSLNTVYTYRNKLRTKAIDRDSFEQEVMRIGSTKSVNE